MSLAQEKPTNGLLMLPEHLQKRAAILGLKITEACHAIGLNFSEATLAVLAISNDMMFFDQQQAQNQKEDSDD